MRIAFDLDNTLIRLQHPFPLEQIGNSIRKRIWLKEPLRLGTTALCRHLQAGEHEVWVYTTSLRPVRYIRRMFSLHGIKVSGIVNKVIHDEMVVLSCSKHPPTFGIELLVDDSKGVLQEGLEFGFRVIQIEPTDESWTDKVVEAVSKQR